MPFATPAIPCQGEKGQALTFDPRPLVIGKAYHACRPHTVGAIGERPDFGVNTMIRFEGPNGRHLRLQKAKEKARSKT